VPATERIQGAWGDYSPRNRAGSTNGSAIERGSALGFATSRAMVRRSVPSPIERLNSNIRQFLARVRRRTKVVSEAAEMIDLALKVYHHVRDSPDTFVEKALIFRSVFS